MKCILKAREGYGAKILFIKQIGDKLTLFEAETFTKEIKDFDNDSIIILKEDIIPVKIGGNLFLCIKDFSEIKEIFFS